MFKRLKNTYFVIGIIFLALLVFFAILQNVGILFLSWGNQSLISAILGWGGIILIIIGILKAVFRKNK